MVQLTKYADYGIVLLSHFARMAADAPASLLSARAISQETQLSLPIVSKILKILVKGGLLASQQGIKGGYRLARPASAISIADIIEALEGPVRMTECTGEIPGVCKTETSCAIKPHWAKINRAILGSLRALSLSAMTSPASELSFGGPVLTAGRTAVFPLTTHVEKN